MSPPLSRFCFLCVQSEDELRAKRALTVACELHRRKVWFDERTANAICYACFHSSSRYFSLHTFESLS
jgi:protein SDA1